jgi:toxin YoeB
MLNVRYSKVALKQLKALKNDKIYLKRIEKLIRNIRKNPFDGIGMPEQLKYQMRGLWSRRINKKDRLIYEVIEPDVIVISMIGHYEG